MNSFKITYSDGSFYQTSANGTLKSFTDYLMQFGGVVVDENPVTVVETSRKIVKVEMVKEVIVHCTRKYTDKVYGPVYEGYVEGVNCEAASIFGSLAHTQCALNVNQADIYVGKVLLMAAEYQQRDLLASDGSIYRAIVEVEVQYS